MSIKDLYNALEKAIDSGEVEIDTRVWCKAHGFIVPVSNVYIDDDGDLIISEN